MSTTGKGWRTVDPSESPSWDRWVRRHAHATVFHGSAWAKVLRDTYGYAPSYGVYDVGDDAPSLFPMVEVASLFTGRRGSCLPFTDACGPLIDHPEAATAEALQPLMDFGRHRGWRYLEVRGGDPLPGGAFVPSHEFVEHRLALEASDEAQRAKLSGMHRRNLAKALAGDVVVERSSSLAAIEAYYALHSLTRRRHGVPPQPLRFFRAIHEHLLANGEGFVSLARLHGAPIAGAVFLHAGRDAIYKFAASDPEHWRRNPNNLVLWDAIAYYRAEGFRTLSLGRSDLDAEGLVKFKRGWGADERPLTYTRAALRANGLAAAPARGGGGASAPAPASGPGAATSLAKAALRRLPLGVLQLCGRIIYRHVG
jgi:hypothetical protein